MAFISNFISKILSEEESEKRKRKFRLVKSIDGKDDYLGFIGGHYYVKHGPKNFDLLGFGEHIIAENKIFDIKNIKIQSAEGKDRYCNWDVSLVPPSVDGVMDYYNADKERYNKLLSKYKDILNTDEEVIRSLNKNERRSSLSYFCNLYEKNRNRVLEEFNNVTKGSEAKDGIISSIVSTTVSRYCTGRDVEIIENLHQANSKEIIREYCEKNKISNPDFYIDLYEMIQLEIKIKIFNRVGWYPESVAQKHCGKDPKIEKLESEIDAAERQAELIEKQGINDMNRAKWDNDVELEKIKGSIERKEKEQDNTINFMKRTKDVVDGLHPVTAAGLMKQDLKGAIFIDAGNAVNKAEEIVEKGEKILSDVAKSVGGSMDAKKTKPVSINPEAEPAEDLFEEKANDYREYKPEEPIKIDIFDEKEEEPTPVVAPEEPVMNYTEVVPENATVVVPEEPAEPKYTIDDITPNDSYFEGNVSFEEMPVNEEENEAKRYSMGTIEDNNRRNIK